MNIENSLAYSTQDIPFINIYGKGVLHRSQKTQVFVLPSVAYTVTCHWTGYGI